MLTLPNMCNHLKKFGTYMVNLIKELNCPDIVKCFKEAETTQLIWDRS